MRNATNEELQVSRNHINNISVECIHIPLVEGTTNGDVMKKLFPNALIEEKYFGIIEIGMNNLPLWKATQEWWNAPYKN